MSARLIKYPRDLSKNSHSILPGSIPADKISSLLLTSSAHTILLDSPSSNKMFFDLQNP